VRRDSNQKSNSSGFIMMKGMKNQWPQVGHFGQLG
jgi:hypothetical protein